MRAFWAEETRLMGQQPVRENGMADNLRRVCIYKRSIGDTLGMAMSTKTVRMNQSIHGPVDHTHVISA